MDRLSPHGIRAPFQPSRRGFLIAMIGGGVMLGYARSGLAAVEFLSSGTQEFSTPAPRQMCRMAHLMRRLTLRKNANE